MNRQEQKPSLESSSKAWKNSPIDEYYRGIRLGNITVGRYIRQWYDYILKGLENQSFYYSPKAYNRAARFIENFCHHHEGKLAPQLIKLELWQKAFLAVIFGIVTRTGNGNSVKCCLSLPEKTVRRC